MARAKSKAEETKKLSVIDIDKFSKENSQYHYNFEDNIDYKSFSGSLIVDFELEEDSPRLAPFHRHE